ncbi:phage tail sheath family protein [Streptomyces sp. NPDC020607]|uniref:phage tail sheath family protein n=1 Tax=Streptomyces sp. NPDC020607 TaxID=3365082 RepID=UPI0037B0B235
MSNIIEEGSSSRGPGFTVTEAASGVRSVEAAKTAVAVFLATSAGTAADALHPVRLISWKQFEQYTAASGGEEDGEPRIAVSETVRAAVYGWFTNGGSECYLAPVATERGLTSALGRLESVEDVTIVVAPDLWSGTTARADAGLIAAHCEQMGNRVAVLHLPEQTEPSVRVTEVLEIGEAARRYATVYHPWLEVPGPDGETTVTVPPSGHVAGVWARVDQERGVHKAPANVGLRGVTGLTLNLTDQEQAGLNDQGVNAIRSFPGTGLLVWGARTLAAGTDSDVEHAYLNVRRSVNFIKQSIHQSTNWAVFEPNDDRLQTSVRAMTTGFLTGLWRRGMLVGQSPDQAFYVVCDETNNPPEKVAQGELVVEVGVALVRSAEFITFQISQILDQNA